MPGRHHSLDDRLRGFAAIAVPQSAFDVGGVLAMIGVALAAAVTGVAVFIRRDLEPG